MDEELEKEDSWDALWGRDETPAANERSLDFLGDVAGIIPQLTGQFNKGYQQNQLAIAQANAQQAAANAQTEALRIQNGGASRTAWIVGGVAVAVIVLIVIVRN